MKFKVITAVLAVGLCVVPLSTRDSGAQATSASDAVKTQGKAASGGSERSGFKDVLDTPARMSPLASRSLLNGVASAGKRVVCVGLRGHIVYSDDGGKTWTQAKVPVSVDLTSVYFASAAKGWAVGHDGVVLYSSDGGGSWVKQLDGKDVCRIMEKYYKGRALPDWLDSDAKAKLAEDIKFIVDQGPSNPFLDVWFENETTGFVVGAFNLILRTEDGGKSWEPWFDRTDNPNGLHFYCIRPVGGELYLSGEQGMVWKLDRKAKRFVGLQTPYNGTIFSVMGKGAAVLALGQRGSLYRSKDAGASWQRVDLSVKATLLGGTVSEDGRIFLVTQGGNIIVSKDDGATFSEIKRETGLGIPAHAVTVLDRNTLVIAGFIGAQVQHID